MEIFGSYTGGDFLGFYALMLATCVAAGSWIMAALRPPGRESAVETAQEAAFLAGGSDRHTLAVIADLHAKGALAPGEKAKLRVAGHADPGDPAERAVLAKLGDFALDDVHKSLRGPAKTIEARLKRRGLLMSEDEALQLRLYSIAPYGVLFLLGLYRQQAGAALGEPTGFLIALMVLTVIFALLRFFSFNPRTMGGNLALGSLLERSQRVRLAPQAGEVGLAVGLFGTAVLVGTPWESVHAMRQAAGGDGGSSGGGGDTDGGGGSGCGGGGCGGCGG